MKWLDMEVAIETDQVVYLQRYVWVGQTLYRLIIVLDRHKVPDKKLRVALAKVEPGGEWHTIIDDLFDTESGYRLRWHIMHALENPEDGVVEFLL